MVQMIFSPRLLFALMLPVLFLGVPERGSSQQDPRPKDSVRVLSQPGSDPFTCCHTLIITNRQTDGSTITEVRVRLLGESGRFVPGEAGSPSEWSIFLDPQRISWITQTTEAEIDSGETQTSFRFCLRDTGIYRFVWETYSIDGLLSSDTLRYICSEQDNCDDVFFRPVPTSERCGFDFDLLSENGQQQVVNTLRLEIISPGVTFDTVGSRLPAGWRILNQTSRFIEYRTTGDGLKAGEFTEGFRRFFNTSVNPIRVAWFTRNFDQQICRDTLLIQCGITAPDTLYTRRTLSDDSCCRDFLLINTHYPRSPITSFRLALRTPNGEIIPNNIAVAQPWRVRLNQSADTLLVVDTTGAGLALGDTLLITEVCAENDLSPIDSVQYNWATIYEDLVVTPGRADFYCRRDVIFCDSLTARVDSTLTAPTRCITLKLDNRNSRGDVIRKFTFRVDNPGAKRRIVSATPPIGWSLDSFTPDSVIFHRGVLNPGRSQDDFVFCLNIDTNAFDPLRIRYTTWTSEISPLCTDSILLNATLDRACDSLVLTENSSSVDPLCCFDLEVFNRNAKGRPLTAIEIRLPRIDLFFDTASTITSGWNVVTPVFPAIAVAYRGDTLQSGESARFSFCVNAGVVKERPFTFDIVWRTFGEDGVVCFDTLQAVCQGTPGRCDSIYITERPSDEQGCYVSYGIDNLHTPDGVIDNVEFTVLSDDVTILSADATGSAAGFDNISLSPKSVIFRGGSIAPGATAGDFSLDFDDDQKSVILEVCTFEGDFELCCEIDTVECSVSGVEDETRWKSLSHAIAPNPTADLLTVALTMADPGSVTLLLFDAQGVEVGRFEQGIMEAGENGFTASLEGLPAGIYHYVVQGGKERGRGKVVIVR